MSRLSVSRRPGEEVCIVVEGRLIVVTVEPKGGVVQTRVSIEAPRDVIIHRREVFEQVLAEGRIVLETT